MPYADDDDFDVIEDITPNTNPETTQADTPQPTYLVFDTENSGLFRYKHPDGTPVPADDPKQPRLASAAFIVCDENGEAIEAKRMYVRPEGWTMAEHCAWAIEDGAKKTASDVNGLYDDFLQEHGVPVREVLDIWTGYIEAGLFPVAHNVQHDCKQMRAELRRAGMPDLFEQTRNSCTMRAMKAYKDQGAPLKNGWMISLKATCEWFGIEQGEAHNDMEDAEACRQILVRLLQDGNLIEPAVHYAGGKK